MKKRDLKVVNRNVNDLIPYANNARTHSPEQIVQIASSIKEFGFNNPILIDEECGVIAGHGRLEGAKKLGLQEVPTIMLEGLSEAQKKAYILADNKIALNSGWDEAFLGIEIQNLLNDGYDLALTGFNADELVSFIDVDTIDMPELSDADEPDVLTMTIHPSQSELDVINQAIERCKNNEGISTNNNAPIIAKICKAYLNGIG